MEDIKTFETRVDQLVGVADSRASDYSETECRDLMEQILTAYQSLKAKLLKAGAEGLVQVRSLVDELDTLSNIRQIGEQIEKGSRYLAALTKQGPAEDR